MKTTVLAVLALALLPLAAAANGCHDDRQAMSCPEGQSWDPAKNACIIHSS